MAALEKISADYGDGFLNKIMIGGKPLTSAFPGEVFWVDNNAGRTGRGTYRAPDTSVDAAYNRCVADRGDIVVCKPNHSETSGAAGSSTWYTADVDSVAVIGLGWGSNKAEWKQSTDTGAHLIVTGDNNVLAGFRIEPTLDDIDGLITITASGFTFANNFVHCAANLGYETMMTLSSGYGETYILDNMVDLRLDDDGESFFYSADVATGLYVQGNVIMGFFSVGVFDIDASGYNNAFFRGNTMINTDTDPGICVLIDSGARVVFVDERYYGGKANTVPVSDASASIFLDCHGIDAPNAGSLVFPAVGAWS